MPNRRLVIPEDVIAKSLLDEETKKPQRLAFVDWACDLVLLDAAWKEGGDKQASALLEINVAIQEKLDGKKAGDVADFTEEEHEVFGRIARKTERGYAGKAAVFNRKAIRFLLAWLAAPLAIVPVAKTNGKGAHARA